MGIVVVFKVFLQPVSVSECVKEASENVGGFLIHDLGSLQFAALSLQKSFSLLC
jgi:hypothetical protein